MVQLMSVIFANAVTVDTCEPQWQLKFEIPRLQAFSNGICSAPVNNRMTKHVVRSPATAELLATCMT